MRKVEISVPFASPQAVRAMSEQALEVCKSFDGKSASHFVAWRNVGVALELEAQKMQKEIDQENAEI